MVIANSAHARSTKCFFLKPGALSVDEQIATTWMRTGRNAGFRTAEELADQVWAAWFGG